MNFSTASVFEILLAIAAIVGIAYRQTRWTAADVSRMWRMPLIFGILGIGILVFGGGRAGVAGVDIALLALELGVAVITGALMGLVARFRPISARTLALWRARRGESGAAEPTAESRTGWVGVLLWVALIAVRIGLASWGHSLGSSLAESPAVILLVVAANRAMNALVFGLRHSRLQSPRVIVVR